MASTISEDLPGVLGFVEDCKGFFPGSKCLVKRSPVGGLGVFAQCDLNEGETLLQLPKSAVFSASNSSISNLLVDSELDGMLALTIAFVYETTVFQERSHWWPYLKSVKIEEAGSLYLPPNYWPDRDMLKGFTLDTLYQGLDPEPDIQQGFQIALELAHRWNKEVGIPIPWKYLDNLEKFVACAYAISSRVFEIDNYHESGLVPIADLFNHHVSTPDVRFVSLYDVCSECGEPGMCRHLVAEALEEEQEQEQEREKKPPSKSGDGLIDMQLIKELESQEEEEVTNPKEKGLVEGVQPDDCVDIVLTQSVPKGQEIFNSYGDYSNALLLARYGFCVENNPWDVAYLGRDLLKLLKDKRLALRARWWKHLGYPLYNKWCALNKEQDEQEEEDKEEEEEDHDEEEEDDENDEEDDEPYWLTVMCIDCNGEPSSPMRALLNLLAFNDRDWNKLRSIEQDVESTGDKIGLLDKPLSKGARKILLNLVHKRKRPVPQINNAAARIMLESERKILEKAEHYLNSNL
ncbi:ZYRO0A03850p [Zygosaccharomyces rouxii]|uniref:ZYRO0A03850p n=1 Tax=Zygosaccharomyces rouxii (strain ATCC 2623 / CBS 732 / NBRC 1130 / NCYC 568 / NRRL Y-229) TaxID=559307 RepID=C5DPJ4_ZYGRC|nr:uncharacterized protein ZYRO0A03850g [Zygosaccharomyces rouxii]KAH9198875.1 hypothetical protein LQ764DRAFT_235840 [Zygosaccharomyces rouxii]CAR25605.1 ZYRO0A03850p [Zygosaccharomyces rouxii]